MMSEPIDLKRLSLDQLIDWIRRQRSISPMSSLSEWLVGVSLESSKLLDVACVDLIERRRAGQAARVEDYIRQFPQLADDHQQLDLIDAEMCVAVELGQSPDLDDYALRFPSFFEAIHELARLHARPEFDSPPLPPSDKDLADQDASMSDSVEIDLDTASTGDPSGDFDFECSRRDGDGRGAPASRSATSAIPHGQSAIPSLPAIPEHALRPPPWFAPEACHASEPGRWLIRGRDSQRGEVMAMKILELDPATCAPRSTAILDACEAASKVRHPVWIAPTVAAIQQGYLGVIRPWIFGVAWLPVAPQREVARQLRDLASLAYCIESAHRAGATHGGIHAGNLLLDHDGKLRLLDAAASRNGVRQWLDQSEESPSPPMLRSTLQRQRLDLEQLLRLITLVSGGWHVPWTNQLWNELRSVTNKTQSGIAEAIGETLIQFADSQRNSAR